MKLWLFWTLATGLAFGTGGRLGATLTPPGDAIVTGYFALGAGLLLAGALQSMAIRQLFEGPGGWLLASFGAVAAMGVFVFGVGLINRDVGWVLGVVLAWVALGALQWLVLRGQVDGAGWWVGATALGLLLAIPTVALTTWISGTAPEGGLGAFLRWVAFGSAYGAVTATAFLWLLRERLEAAVA